MSSAVIRTLIVLIVAVAIAGGCGGGAGAPDPDGIATPALTGQMLVSEVVVKSRGRYPANDACGLPSARRLFCYQEAVPVASAAAGGDPYDWNGGWTPQCDRSFLDGGPNSALVTRTNAQRFTTRQNAYVEQRLASVAGLPAVPHSISRLDRIISVSTTLVSGGSFGSTGERGFEIAELSIRSRENETYRQAIMCGERMEWS